MTTPHSFFKDKPVLITGGLGFLGSNLAHRLVALGARVSLMDCLLPGHGANWLNIEDIRGSVSVHQRDIRDADAMNHLVKDQAVIFHIAGQTSHVDSMTDPLLDVDINCRGNVVLLQAVHQHAPQARVVYCGTRAVYGSPKESPAHEEVTPHPTDIYGVNKWAGEQYHLLFARKFGLHTVCLRLSNAYGPRAQIKAPSFGILNWMLGQALQGKTLRIFGEGNQLRDYTYVDDALSAMLLAAENPAVAGEVLNVSSEQPVTFKHMVLTAIAAAREATGVEAGYEHVAWPEDRKAIEVGDFAASSARARSLLGWSPQVDFEEGISRTVAFYAPHLAAWLA